MTTALEKHLDGCHTKLLRAALNVSCNDHISNKELYRDLPPISTRLSLKVRRLQFSSHCWRSKNKTVSHFFWEPNTVVRRSPETTFIDQLESDTGLKRQDLASVIGNRR